MSRGDSRSRENLEDSFNRSGTQKEYDDDEEDFAELRKRKSFAPQASRANAMAHDEMIKRRTGGTLNHLNIATVDIEKENLHSVVQIRGDGNFREANFSSLKHAPKSKRLFKELLVTGKFKEINKDVEPTVDEQEIYPIDEEDILEYQLFSSIDRWSRRVSNFLNLSAGVIVGMFVVVSIITASVDTEEDYAIYFAQIYTIFVNLAVVFSVAETLINYEKYKRLSDHNDLDALKFQGYFIISLVWTILFML